MTKVSRLYYEQGLRQARIGELLNLSQAKVSRLLKEAEEEGLVRITVSVPLGTYFEMEEKLQKVFNLKDVIVVDSVDDDGQILRDLGAAAAFYVETTIKQGEVMGISSWSATLLAMVDAMHPLPKSITADVVQILGGIGDPAAEAHASHLTQRLAKLTHGQATFLPAPGVVGSSQVRSLHLGDQFVSDAVALFDKVSLALVGIGAIEPSKLLASSGNVFSAQELDFLRAGGAVGDVCLRFFDSSGMPFVSELDDRVIGITADQLRKVGRRVGIAGGQRKVAAIRGALVGGWINVLVTDQHTGQSLLEGKTTDVMPQVFSSTEGVTDHN